MTDPHPSLLPSNDSSDATPPPVERRKRDANSGDLPAGHVVDRRIWPGDRRSLRVDGKPVKLAADETGLERRRGPGRRLSDFTRSAEEGDLTQEQFLFLMSIEAFKKANAKVYPTWTDVLEIVRLLGYRKTMPTEINLRNAEDWRELPTTPSNVRPERWSQRAEIDRSRRNAA
jgi:hypothetical protein